MANEHTPGSPGEGASDAAWSQQAGFSVFFESRVFGSNAAEWRTRLYLDETGEMVTVAGTDSALWTPWITSRVGAATSVSLEVCDTRVTRTKAIDSSEVTEMLIEVAVKVRGAFDTANSIGAAVISAAVAAATREQIQPPG